MEYMITLHSEEVEMPGPGEPGFEEMMGDWMAYNQRLIDGGHYIGGASLAPSVAATVLTKAGDGSTTVTDGPFAETKEQLGGFYIIEAEDLDQALELAKDVPIPVGSFEIRPIAFRPDAEDNA